MAARAARIPTRKQSVKQQIKVMINGSRAAYRSRLFAGVILLIGGTTLTYSLVEAGTSKRGNFGGSGGSAFYVSCPKDAVLVGFSVRSGDWLNKIGIKCRKVNSAGNPVGSMFSPGSPVGGNGGSSWSRNCPNNSAVTRLDVFYGSYVDSFYAMCARASSGLYSNKSFVGFVGKVMPQANGSGTAKCTSNKPARGIYGRSGSYIDKLGLLCHSGSTPK